VQRINVKSAQNMLEAVDAAQTATVFVATAAVADWRPATQSTEQKIKKDGSGQTPVLQFCREPRHPGHRGAVAAGAQRASCSAWALRPKATTW
jgi:phosphopantothenoylcysteine synthetase/decarboxylase